MSESKIKSMSAIPKWDGKAESCPRYLLQLEALAKFYDCGDALDESEMANRPTKAAFTLLDKTNAAKKQAVDLYKANKRMVAIMTLGQGSDHELTVIKKTKKVDHPAGVLHRAITMLKKKNKPNDASAEIELDAELERIPFQQRATDYYNQVVTVMARFKMDTT